ncbi:MAG: hypothetical protein WC517_04130 [Patescibacteria group bacterium]
MNKKILLAIIAGLLILPLGAAAVSVPQNGNGASKNASGTPALTNTAAVEAIRMAVRNAISRCPIIESKIQVKVTDFDNVKIRHLAVYDNLRSRLNAAADRLAARGVDVSALQADLSVLDQKIAKFNADYSDYSVKLRAGQGFACGQPESQFRAKLKEARAAMQLVHQDALDIRAYIGGTIKVELMRIRNSLKAAATTTPEQTAAAAESETVEPIAPALPVLD